MNRVRFHHPAIGRMLSVVAIGFLAAHSSGTFAQVTNITSSGLSTQVSVPTVLPSGQTNFDITGGTRPGGGTNLFHSFGDFSVGTNHIANFLNETARPTTNILSRVTGGNPSNIFGEIATTNFPGANLYLINPAGVVFGSTATLNVSGSVKVSTADYLRLADGIRFNALPGPQDGLLSSAPVAAFGFLRSTGSIGVEGGRLEVANGQGLTLVGGDIEVVNGQLKAPSGQINLVSIAGRGEAGVTADGLTISAGTPMGNILVSGTQPANLVRLDASGDEGGAVFIRGGQVSLARTEITTEARTANHTGAGIVVEATDSATLNDVIWRTGTSGFPNPNTVGGAGPVSLTAPSVTASTLTVDTSAGNNGPGGDVAINVGRLTASDLQIFSFVHGDSPGSASGNVSIRATGDVSLQGGDISTAAFGARDAGQVSVQAKTLTVTDGASLSSGSHSIGPQGGNPAGRAGNIAIDVETLTMQTTSTVPQISTDTSTTSRGGDIAVTATDAVTISRGAIETRTSFFGPGDGGSITLSTPVLTLEHFGRIGTATTGDGSAGDMSLHVGTLNVRTGGGVESATFGPFAHGSAGNINIEASKSVSLSGVSDVTSPAFPSQISSMTTSVGNAGRVSIVTPILHVQDQAVVSASSEGAGRAGTIVINAARNISTDNGNITASGPGQGGDVSLHAGEAIRLRNGSVISADSTDIGNAGQIVLDAGRNVVVEASRLSTEARRGEAGQIDLSAGDAVRLINGAVVSASNVRQGPAGQIVLNAGGKVLVDASQLTAEPIEGQPGQIHLSAGEAIRVVNGSRLTVNNNGVGPAGLLTIDAGTVFVGENSAFLAQTGEGHGGTILITAPDRIRLTNSIVSTGVGGSPASVGGTIAITSDLVRLRNSRVVSNASNGSGGSITIKTNAFRPDAASIVEAVSLGGGGADGTVSIQPLP